MSERTTESSERDTAVCPHCGDRVGGFETMPVDGTVVGDQSNTVGVVVCPSCEAVVGAYAEYERSDIVEGGSETWERVKGVDE
ncbi:MAG: hypothetical protein ACLFSW_00065 [Halobacteriales archaeon]